MHDTALGCVVIGGIILTIEELLGDKSCNQVLPWIEESFFVSGRSISWTNFKMIHVNTCKVRNLLILRQRSKIELDSDQRSERLSKTYDLLNDWKQEANDRPHFKAFPAHQTWRCIDVEILSRHQRSRWWLDGDQWWTSWVAGAASIRKEWFLINAILRTRDKVI